MIYHKKDSPSQNFIKYPRLVRELLRSTDIQETDTVIEIGPGKGIITRELSNYAEKIIAVEKDGDLAEALIKNSKDLTKVQVITQDFLDYVLPNRPYKIVANIPFSITAKIINKVLKSPTLATSMYLIMQKEAAEKFAGIPAETQSSILTKPWYEVEILGDIDRTNFTMKPQVIIVFVQFILREKPYILDEDKSDFRDFVIYGFNVWQPTLLEAFKKIFTYTQIKTLRKTLKLDGLKPSEVSFDTWLLLFKTAKKILSEDKKEIFRAYRKKYNASTM